MESCMASIFKYLLFGTNFLVFLLGCAVMGFSIYAMVDGESLSNLVHLADENTSLSMVDTAAILLIVVSVFIIIISFFGCCGAIKENRCLLGIYLVIVLCLGVGMIAGAVLGGQQNIDDLSDPLKKTLAKYDQSSKDDDVKAIVHAWDDLQKEYKCCGVEGYEDYHEVNAAHFGPAPLPWAPESCCEKESGDKCAMEPKNLYQDGCFTKFEEDLEANMVYVIGTAAAVIVFMFFNFLFAVIVCMGIDKHRYA